jgi:Ricin-type beta-trefoil lectin domain/Putative Ig domain
VTVTSPGTQTTGVNGGVSVQLAGASSGSNPLQWTATGLPPGLSISGSGLITGTATTAGTYSPVVYASDDTGATGSASFTWNVVADTVTVTSPGNQTSYAQAAVNVPLSGSSSAGLTPLAWGGTLPAGMVINSSGSTTGVITGAPYNAGTVAVTATATDTGGISGSASFTWTIKPDVGKQLKETSAKRCLNDNESIATAGNAVNVWRCQPAGSLLGLGAQDWSFVKGELKVFGLCLSDPKSGGTGTKLALARCTGVTSQVWTHQANGEYVLKLNGLCLTDPNDSTKNGTQVTVTACKASTSQQWALP